MPTIRMLKTACGPNGSFAAGKKYKVSDEIAELWCEKPNPSAVIVGATIKKVVEPEVVVDAPQEEEAPKPKAKRATKYRPGKAE